QKEFTQYYPALGWVEHDAMEIWQTQLAVARQVIQKAAIHPKEIAAIGITNQRETWVIWDKTTGLPISKAIVWQDRRTAYHCERLKKEGYEEKIRRKTGLVIDAYFSATKAAWILENIPSAKEKNEQLAAGTIDSWLIWQLSKGKLHLTDVTNASRTMLFNIHTLTWDEELLDLFQIPRHILPDVRPCSEVYGYTHPEVFGEEIPIAGVAGDQHAALFGQLCLQEGNIKNTYGTGCFLMLNTGKKPVFSASRLLTTIAFQYNQQTFYALEGSVFIGGAAIQWLRDGLQVLNDAQESELLAPSVPDNGGVYFVPAMTGLGAPYWDAFARGSIFGITRATTKAHLVRATLEAVAFQVNDVLKAMEKDIGQPLSVLNVDGGVAKNNFLLQWQANISSMTILRSADVETTAKGVAFLAGISVGFWKSVEELFALRHIDHSYQPNMDEKYREKILQQWKKAVQRSMNWD
ncbi:MAG: glycerol kinase GlpK, partial [Flammeovirgaceae bacterium]|nr:glycerol kinase GlpK [Flammeovirgaceae bacterium]